MKRRLIVIAAVVCVVLTVSVVALRSHSPDRERSIVFYTLGDMVDPGVLRDFSEETGIPIRHVVIDPDRSHALRLSGCSLLLTDLPFLELLDSQGQLTFLDAQRIPSADRFAPAYQNAVRRNTHAAAVPALWSTMGLLHDSAASGVSVRGWADLFDPSYPGTVAITGSAKKALAGAMLAGGRALDSTQPEDCFGAVLTLNRLDLHSPGFRSVGALGDAFRTGSVTLAPCYAGQALPLMSELPRLSFVFPSEGTWQTVLGYAIPRQCSDTDAAYALLTYLCRPYVMARNAAYSGWSTPSLDAWKLLSPSRKKNPLAYGKSGLAVTDTLPFLDIRIGGNAPIIP